MPTHPKALSRNASSRLQPGDRAPALQASDLNDQPCDLAALKGRVVLVSFYRYASCPLCNLRIHKLRQRWPELEREGLSMLALFQSSAERMRAYVGKEQTPFPLIPDPLMEHYQRWKVEESMGGLLKAGAKAGLALLGALRQGYLPGRIDGPMDRMPADFLVGPDGSLLECLYASHAGEHLEIDSILQHLRSHLKPGPRS